MVTPLGHAEPKELDLAIRTIFFQERKKKTPNPYSHRRALVDSRSICPVQLVSLVSKQRKLLG